ncbi:MULTISPECIES: LysR family transcriptional regulator [Kocuria]|uniref:LysR family transcriptional regulator n=1 Tax=Kocuria TaxID=57493 RepID=UPI00057F3F68|nr:MULTISPECIES: LysR family transcriptional regulator [Kocuria]KIC67715.1 LysR family transcriptional regulator [Kocuria rhizophila]MCT1545683.1 LysR family transcriptional regulator [Kocuria rhizophila]MCT2171488.1 LysR family transcriptional regulator [Kocuria rhizophila]MDA4827928.1 LysR family transcriptional regulator [Kocuria rhizophila]MDN3463470.1 LysR family transcriptional regulator [Kocuria sp. APC 4018]
MEIRQLTCFIAVAEERHFGRAADRLHMAQPALSLLIRQLEEHLGARLLDRTTRRVDLTPAGQELLDRGRRVLHDLELLEADVRREGDSSAGVLRLGFAGAAAYDVVPELARAVREGLPGVTLSLRGELPSPALESGLRDGSLDAALLHPPVASPGIRHRVVGREPLVVALPVDAPLTARPSVGVGALEGLPVVAHPPGSPLHRAAQELFLAAGLPLRIGQVAQDTASTLSLVAAGGGVALVPASVRALQLRGVVYAELEGSPQIDLALAWRDEDRSARLRAFLDVALGWADSAGATSTSPAAR